MNRWIWAAGGLALALSLTACADRRVTRLEGDFGTSHRLAVFNQTYNPEAEKNLEPVTGLDGQASGNNLQRYRESFKEETQEGDITINIGK